jgi:DNA-binding NarL/FixJ family response regulator
VGELRIFVVFRDAIYAHGLHAALIAMPDVESVDYATTIANAWEDEALRDADIVLLDAELGGAEPFVRELTAETAARLVLCTNGPSGPSVLKAIANGSIGVLARDALTPDALTTAVRAAVQGIGVIDTTTLLALAKACAEVTLERPMVRMTEHISAREQAVLSLVASGLSNREIAQQLSYSERTIKNVLHDVVTKLGVKSRSQAVAMAVREQII